jgi:hypothetical protein
MPARYKLPEWSRVLSVVNARRNMQDRPARTATHRIPGSEIAAAGCCSEIPQQFNTTRKPPDTRRNAHHDALRRATDTLSRDASN